MENLTEKLMRAWWSPWRTRALVAAGSVLLLVLALSLIGGGEDAPGAATPKGAGTSTPTTAPRQEAALQPGYFAPLDPAVALPGGELQKLVLNQDIEVWAEKVAKALGVKEKLEKHDNEWRAGGLVVRDDGTYTYVNSKVKDAPCNAESVCGGDTELMREKDTADDLDQAVERVLGIVKAGLPDTNIQPRGARSNRARITVRLMIQKGPTHLSETAEVTVMPDGSIANAQGILGKWELGEMVRFEDAVSAFGRIGEDGRMVRSGLLGGPRAGATIKIVSTRLSAVQDGDEILPAWAYEDAEGNVWVVEAQPGSGETSPGVTVPTPDVTVDPAARHKNDTTTSVP